MKKLILTSIALSISIMSACTPTPAVNGINPTGVNITGKLTKTQVKNYLDCVASKITDADKKARYEENLKKVYDGWVTVTDDSFGRGVTPQLVLSMTQMADTAGCNL